METNDISIELLGGPNAGSLTHIVTITGSAKTGISAAGPGFILDPTGDVYDVPGVPLNGTATLELLAWDGNFTSYNAAANAGGNVGEVMFQNPTGGGNRPPAIPSDLTGMPALILGYPPEGIWTLVRPRNQTNLAGTDTTFSFTAYSYYGWEYQWLHNGTNIPNA